MRGHTLAARGWVKEGGDLFETMKFLDSVGCSRYVVTDVARDGMMSGPNIDLLREVAERTDAKVTASGGISKLDDLRDIKILSDFGVDSAILGKSLYARAFTLEERSKSPADRYGCRQGPPPPPVTVGWASGGPCSLLRAAFLRAGELALLDELPEQGVILLVLLRIRLSERGYRLVELVGAPKIVGDGHAVAGAGMRVRQAPCAHAARSDNPSAFR